jgi:hypothetical protein
LPTTTSGEQRKLRIMMPLRDSPDRLLAQLRNGRPPNFFPHLLVAVVAPIADALALSSSPSRRSLKHGKLKFTSF